MKEALINPQFNGNGVDNYLKSINIPLSPSQDGYDVTSVRQNKDVIFYCFKYIEDLHVFIKTLVDNNIPFTAPSTSIGARYPHNVGINKI